MTDPRLGRIVNHDPRSLDYLIEASLGELASVRHTRYVPVFDQGEVGSCTGNAATGCLGTGLFYDDGGSTVLTQNASLDEQYAVGIYSDAEDVDGDGPYPPNDNGSSGLSVAKVLKSRGLISGYRHATSLQAVLTSLAAQPVIVGTSWHQAMFTPDADGRLHPTGPVEGGHEYVLDQLDVEAERVWMQNSWGTSWGINGRAYLTYADLGTLLADQGDCTAFVPVSQPAPTPTPPSPFPPSPGPADPVAAFVAAANEWLSHTHLAPPNKEFEQPLRDYLTTLNTKES